MHLIRKLLPRDTDLLIGHYLRLDSEDRQCRFAGYVSPERVAEYCRQIDWSRTDAIGWFEEGELIAATELVRLSAPNQTGTAELAVTVEKAFQDRGTGTELFRRILTIARNRGVRGIVMRCLLENRRMQTLAKKYDGRLLFLDGEVESEVRVAQADGLSLLQEALDDGFAIFGLIAEQWTGKKRNDRAA